MNAMNAMVLAANGDYSAIFAILGIILVLCLVAFTRKNKAAQAEDTADSPAAVTEAASAVEIAQADSDDDEIAAVIAAVMALVTAQSGELSYEEVIEGFHVRRIRRIPSVSQWGKAGREELLSSKNFY
jgi:hypothetical protein